MRGQRLLLRPRYQFVAYVTRCTFLTGAPQLSPSPLARGTRDDVAGERESAGLIPARAGNTCRCAMFSASFRAHPRSRGEHALRLFRLFCGGGSSPLARGTRAPDLSGAKAIGLIPARAGNTFFCSAAFFSDGAHPRSRGEHTYTLDFLPALVGSSPLARGTRLVCGLSLLSSGLIPARAGNTMALPLRILIRWAHPRSRGEHTKNLPVISWEEGSSPLARGTRIRKQ